MKRVLAAFGVLAAAQMIVGTTVDGLTRPGFDETRHWISHLALGPDGWRGTVNLATCGLWLVLAGAGMRRRLVPCCGLLLMSLAVVRTDAGLGFPPGTPTEHTTRGLVHQVISVALAAAGIGAVARLGARWVAGVMAVAFAAATVLVLLDAAGILAGTPHGLLERVALYAGFAVIGRAAWDSCGPRPRAGPPTGGAGPARTPGAGPGTAETEGGR